MCIQEWCVYRREELLVGDGEGVSETVAKASGSGWQEQKVYMRREVCVCLCVWRGTCSALSHSTATGGPGTIGLSLNDSL